jgi:ABC-type methionine transport system ATPase subunit
MYTLGEKERDKMIKKKVELTIPVGLKEQPIIYQIGRNFKIIPNIIEASFSTSLGWAILDLEGEEAEVNKLIAHLEQRGVKVRAL